jgi:hypothetical protein
LIIGWKSPASTGRSRSKLWNTTRPYWTYYKLNRDKLNPSALRPYEA